MNTFGTLFRVSILGESHGHCIGTLIDGCPPGIPLQTVDFATDLARRQGGGRTGTTPRKEADLPILRSGILNGHSTGAPLLIEFANSNTDSAAYSDIRHHPRPGHADFVAHHKFGGFNDHRGGGHFSGRLTAAIVAAGVVAKKVSELKIEATIESVGGSRNIDQVIEAALAAGDSVGAVVQCRINGLPIGVGEPFFDSVESVLAHACFAIPAIKGIEFGAGFAAATMKGSDHNDLFVDCAGTTQTNHAGGINGGLSNGNEVVFRVAVKPASSIAKTQSTINLATGELSDLSVRGRHDACIGLRVPPVVEAMAAISLTDLLARAGKLRTPNSID